MAATLISPAVLAAAVADAAALAKIPADVRATPHFVEWYAALVGANHQLVDVQSVEWVFRVGPTRYPLFVALHVSVRVSGENRVKSNEVVIIRPSISSVCAFSRGATPAEDRFVLVEEYRTPVLNSRGVVLELPGGSSFNASNDAIAVGLAELKEETGLVVPRERVSLLGAHQIAATMVANRAHVLAVELTNEEMDSIAAQSGVPRGNSNAAEQELTYLIVATRSELLGGDFIDWATRGMIAATLRV
jgi:hypothetical protein